jgi:hypothetical protein
VPKKNLICVTEGVYRTDSGIHVFLRRWQDKDRPWVVCWTDFMSVRHEDRFRTLKECREYLNK